MDLLQFMKQDRNGMIKVKEKNSGLIKLILMVVLSGITQIIALMKSSMVAGIFGVSSEMDAFNVANSISSFIFSFVFAGISAVVIPCYVKKTIQKQVDVFLTAVIGGVALVASTVLLIRKPLLSILTGRSTTFTSLSGALLCILIFSNFFSIFSGVTAAYFQYIEKYNLPKLVTLGVNTAVVIFLGTCQNITIYQYTLVVGAGIVISAVIDIAFAIKYGWRYFPNFCLKEPETKKLLKMFVPTVFSSGVYQLSLMIDSSIASRLNTGDITILNYANQVSSMINTLLVSNLLLYFYPKLIKDIEDKKGQYSFWKKTYFFHAVVCLVIAGYITIGKEGISLLFEHGAFGHQAVDTVFRLSVIYVVIQQFNVIKDMLYRYFYAFGDTKSVTKNSLIATISNIITSLLLVSFLGLYGIVIGTAVSSLASLIGIMVCFKKQYGYSESVEHIILSYGKTITITVVTIAVIYVTKIVVAIENILLSILFYGCETVLVYLVLTLLFNKTVRKTALEI